jgi:hypothetical protein
LQVNSYGFYDAFCYIDAAGWIDIPEPGHPLFICHFHPRTSLTILEATMKFVRILALLVISVIGVQALAQESIESTIELIRSDLKTQKKALIEKVMNFTEKEANQFWPFYREYSLELSKIGDQRLAVLKDFAANYDKIDDKKAEELVKKSGDLQKARTDLMAKYYKKAGKFLGMKRAAQWIQAENQIMMLVDAKMASETPLLK